MIEQKCRRKIRLNPRLEFNYGYRLLTNESQLVQIRNRFVVWTKLAVCARFRYSFICQGTSTRSQRRDLFGLPSQTATCKYQSKPLKGS